MVGLGVYETPSAIFKIEKEGDQISIECESVQLGERRALRPYRSVAGVPISSLGFMAVEGG